MIKQCWKTLNYVVNIYGYANSWETYPKLYQHEERKNECEGVWFEIHPTILLSLRDFVQYEGKNEEICF